MSNYKQIFLTKCKCGATTSKKYSREHNGLCKLCATGEQPKSMTKKKEYKPSMERDMVDYIAEVQGRNELSQD